MHVCLISSQIAEWGKIGGFGTATRAIGAGLVRRGVEVSAVVPLRADHGQQREETLDGIRVHGTGTLETLFSTGIFDRIQADLYHSQEPTVASWLAQRAAPNAVHVVTCRDPRGFADHLTELRFTSMSRRALFPVSWFHEASPLVKASVRRADAVFCPAPCIAPRARKLYGAGVEPTFVPSPADLPEHPPVKAEKPTALFVGRWDRRKRIERFFELAERMPEVQFIAVGAAHDSRYDRSLRERYGGIPNLAMPGFVSRFENSGLNALYSEAWVLVNTSAREGLPYTFIEGAAFGCSILSCLDPDGFARRFGYYAQSDDFEAGMKWLLEEDRWRERGRAGAAHVAEHFSEQASIDQHLAHYERLLAGKRNAS